MSQSTDVSPLERAKTPVGPGTISVVGLLLAVILVGVGAVGVQAALVKAGLLTGKPWLTWALDRPNGLTPAGWMLPAGAVVALVGLWLVLTALRPRPRTAVAVRAATGVFLRPRDLSRLAVAAADEVAGVQDARASATRTKVTLRITSTAGEADRDQVSDAVTAAVTARLSALEKPVRVTVRTVGGTR
ncbi:MAG: DUF6286 domain-containing protein [Lapillicoccus sp.]